MQHIAGGGADELSSIKAELSRATNAEQMRWRHSQQLVLRIAEGLKNMPVVDAGLANGTLTSEVVGNTSKIYILCGRPY